MTRAMPCSASGWSGADEDRGRPRAPTREERRDPGLSAAAGSDPGAEGGDEAAGRGRIGAVELPAEVSEVMSTAAIRRSARRALAEGACRAPLAL